MLRNYKCVKIKMHFQLVSDLHLEYNHDKDVYEDPMQYIKPSASYLILAGDVGSLYLYSALRAALERICSHFKAVLYVAGNHEYYIQKSNDERLLIDDLSARLHTLSDIKGLYVLDRDSAIVGDICFVGCTLWSKPYMCIPKYIVRIHGISDTLYETLHRNDLNYISNMMDYCRRENLRMVVVTHYSPSFKTIENCKSRSKRPTLYATDLHKYIKHPIEMWCHGHTHNNMDINVGGIPVISNQRGKTSEKINSYLNDRIVTIPKKISHNKACIQPVISK